VSVRDGEAGRHGEKAVAGDTIVAAEALKGLLVGLEVQAPSLCFHRSQAGKKPVPKECLVERLWAFSSG